MSNKLSPNQQVPNNNMDQSESGSTEGVGSNNVIFDQQGQVIQGNQFNIAGDITNNIHDPMFAGRDINIYASSSVETQAYNRQTLLHKVHQRWIDGVLETSLSGAKLIPCKLKTQPNAVDHQGWENIIHMPLETEQELSEAINWHESFDIMNQSLLVLGEPGGGKTTLMLQIVQTMLESARHNPTKHIPVVFTLTSWAATRLPLDRWLVNELHIRYSIPVKVGAAMIAKEHLALFLDGLDEVGRESLTECISAINEFRKQHLTPIAVCCRSAQYLEQPLRLQLEGAVVVQPLTLPQIDEYLGADNTNFTLLHKRLQEDATLLDLAKTPLTLNILRQVYQNTLAFDEIDNFSSGKEVNSKYLLDHYITAMFRRLGHNKHSHYSPEQTVEWLSWLARQMTRHSTTEFFIEEIQPTWLVSPAQQILYEVGVRVIGGLVMLLGPALGYWLGTVVGMIGNNSIDTLPKEILNGMAIGLAFCLMSILASTTSIWLTKSLTILLTVISTAGLTMVLLPLDPNIGDEASLIRLSLGAMAGLLIGLPSSFVGMLLANANPIRIIETWHWSWPRAMKGLLGGLLPGLLIGSTVGFINMSTQSKFWGDMLAVASPISLIGMTIGGLKQNEKIDVRLSPNQGIWRATSNALRINGILVLTTLILLIPSGIFDGNWVNSLSFGLIIGIPLALTVSLFVGGAVCIQHCVLRWILYCNGWIARDLANFLDHATDHILLRKVGGGYIFVHSLLMEHFISSQGDRSKVHVTNVLSS